MWLQVTLAAILASACALETLILKAEINQRLVDIFGEPPSEDLDDGGDLSLEGNDTAAGNNTDCTCLPYSRCKVTNDSFYGPDDLEARHMSCVNQFDWCCERRRVRPPRRPARTGCGWTSAEKAGTGGAASFGEFPWVVAILHKSAGKPWTPSELVGGGSIIHASVVLTAAHKVDGQAHAQLKCRAGVWNASSSAERLPHQDRTVAKIVKHEGFYRRLMSNSIALIFLVTPFDLIHFPHVGVACIARSMPPAGTLCYGTGWGKDRYGVEGKYAEVLKKVEMPLVGQRECSTQLRGTRLGARYELAPSLACAGGARADTCTGDGGAPLVCHDGDSGQRYSVVGMAAWGLGCGDELPGVYVHVPQFYDWIRDVVAAHRYVPAFSN